MNNSSVVNYDFYDAGDHSLAAVNMNTTGFRCLWTCLVNNTLLILPESSW